MKRLALLCFVLFIAPVHADILMKWERVPLVIDLEINQERLIFVEKNVQVGYPPSLSGKLRIQNTGGVVYLKASQAFDITRVHLKDLVTGEVILLDLRASDQKHREPIRLVYENQLDVTTETTASEPPISQETLPGTSRPALPVPAALTRYAAQSLYAPLRTIEPLSGVHTVPHRLPKSLPTLLPGLPVNSTPLEAWGLDGYVVTAVKITNQQEGRLTLDPRELQGRFYAATFQHNWLGGKGSATDTTTVYLITEGSADKAIVPQARGYKPQKKKVKKIIKTTTKTEPVKSTFDCAQCNAGGEL